MGGENTTYAAICHAPEQAHTRCKTRPWIQVLERSRADNDGDCEHCLCYHPNYKSASFQQLEELIEVMSRLSNGAKDGY